MQFKVSFEATGFTDDKALVGQSFSEQEALGFTEVSLAQGTLPKGVAAVIGGYVTDDDEQGDSDIHVFVHIDLLVDADSEDQAERMAPPVDLLTKISDLMTGEFSLDLESNSWEVTEVDRMERPRERVAA